MEKAATLGFITYTPETYNIKSAFVLRSALLYQ